MAKTMPIRALALGLLLVGAWATAALAGEPAQSAPKTPAEKPITTAGGPVGDLLKKWYAEGTAAGNVGDWYDNRDREHSGLNMSPYPQLRKVAYSEPELKVRADWALFAGVRPYVTFGNSSTASGVHQGGSNSRHIMSAGQGLAILYSQYARNNLYIYPEHVDYDPGHNGCGGGFGDVYPTNTPYLMTSQGSSGSDQPFMRAIPFTLAAFRPEVKRTLVEKGLVMPTLQMIFRMSNKHLADPKEYLTGKAHPPVYEGSWVNEQKMVEMAHGIEAGTIPPMIQLDVTEETKAVPGQDYFDAHASEKLGDTPCVIARIYRSLAPEHRMVVSAEKSYDVNKRPLTFQWVVLQGDAKRIRIRPMNKEGSVAELVVPWHERFPVPDRAGMETNRVDIGVFAHNGAYYSSPGFVTLLCLDSEARAYDDKGRILEIGYAMGTTDLRVQKWPEVLDLFKADAKSLEARLLKKPLKEAETAAILAAAEEYRPARAKEDGLRDKEKPAAEALKQAGERVKQAEAKVKEAKDALAKTPDDAAAKEAVLHAESVLPEVQAERKQFESDSDVARRNRENAGRAAEEILSRKRDPLQGSVKDRVEGVLRGLTADADFYAANEKDLADRLKDEANKNAVAAGRRRLVAQNLLKAADGPFVLTPLKGGGPANLTRYEKALVEQFNDGLVGRVAFKDLVTCSWNRNYVDARVSLERSWRDVYHYTADGHLLGWTRYDGDKQTEFGAGGEIVVEKDPRGRCAKGREVRYQMEVPDKQRPSIGPLKWVVTDQVVTYEYAGDGDWKGRVAHKETVFDKK